MAGLKCKGFTLIELLISLSIFSLVIVLSSGVYSLFSTTWEKKLSDFESSVEFYRTLFLLDHSLNSIQGHAVRKEQQFGYYFLGRDEGFTAVVLNPLFSVGSSAVIRVFKENSESPGFLRLVYEEASLEGIELKDPDQTLPFKHRVIIADKLKSLDFSYYTWASRGEMIDPTDGGLLVGNRKWLKNTDAFELARHPEILKIDIDGVSLRYKVFERPNYISSIATDL